VTVELRRGRKRVAKASAKVARDCSYRATVRAGRKRGKLSLVVRAPGAAPRTLAVRAG
jgi:hypothetical protein